MACCVAISQPRVARSGNDLPNARLLSSVVHPDMDKPNFVHTLMLMLFGQFLDHDMSKTAISKIAATADGQFSAARRHAGAVFVSRDTVYVCVSEKELGHIL